MDLFSIKPKELFMASNVPQHASRVTDTAGVPRLSPGRRPVMVKHKVKDRRRDRWRQIRRDPTRRL